MEPFRWVLCMITFCSQNYSQASFGNAVSEVCCMGTCTNCVTRTCKSCVMSKLLYKLLLGRCVNLLLVTLKPSTFLFCFHVGNLFIINLLL